MRDTRVAQIETYTRSSGAAKKGREGGNSERKSERSVTLSATMSATQRAHAHPSSVSRKQVNPLSPSPATSTGPW